MHCWLSRAEVCRESLKNSGSSDSGLFGGLARDESMKRWGHPPKSIDGEGFSASTTWVGSGGSAMVQGSHGCQVGFVIIDDFLPEQVARAVKAADVGRRGTVATWHCNICTNKLYLAHPNPKETKTCGNGCGDGCGWNCGCCGRDRAYGYRCGRGSHIGLLH